MSYWQKGDVLKYLKEHPDASYTDYMKNGGRASKRTFHRYNIAPKVASVVENIAPERAYKTDSIGKNVPVKKLVISADECKTLIKEFLDTNTNVTFNAFNKVHPNVMSSWRFYHKKKEIISMIKRAARDRIVKDKHANVKIPEESSPPNDISTKLLIKMFLLSTFEDTFRCFQNTYPNVCVSEGYFYGIKGELKTAR